MSISFSSTALSVVGTWMPAQPVGSAAIAADHAAQADERAAADLLQPRADRLGLGCDFLTHEAAMYTTHSSAKKDWWGAYFAYCCRERQCRDRV